MNILFLTNHLDIGGVTSYCFTLAKGLKQRGHNVYIASSGGGMLFRFINEGINYIPIPIRTKQELSPKIILCAFKLYHAARKNNIDIVHSNSRTTQVLGSLLQRYAGLRHVYTCHGFFKRRLHRRIFPCWGQEIIAISEQVKENLVHDFGVREDRIRLIYNGIDIKNFKRNGLYD